MPAATPISYKRVLGLSIAIVLAYMLVREVVIAVITTADWPLYDLWMTLPRSIAFIACLALAYCAGGFRRWGWHGHITWRGIMLMALFFFAFTFYHLGGVRMITFSRELVIGGWLRSIPVALFEEACFRGLIYLALRERFGALSAATISSLLFAVFHLHAQPVSEWPMIFVFGMLACGALELGTGLVWLALTHLLVDGWWFHLATRPGFEHPEMAWGGLTLFALALALNLCWNLSKPPLKAQIPK